MDSVERLARRAVIGLSGAKLVIELNRRKHMASGSRLLRTCICDKFVIDSLELHIPRLLRPVCQLWPAIRQRMPVGDRLFPSWNGRRALSDLRGFASGRNWL